MDWCIAVSTGNASEPGFYLQCAFWTGCLKQMSNLQMTGKQGNGNNWGSGWKREEEQEGKDYSMEEFWCAQGGAEWKECFSKGCL